MKLCRFYNRKRILENFINIFRKYFNVMKDLKNLQEKLND